LSDIPEAVAESVKTLVDSLYVPPDDKKLTLFFRPPSNHEIKVCNLIVRRVSYHSSTRADRRDTLLKITEAKNLSFRAHHRDHRLWQAYEARPRNDAEYIDMLCKPGRIHYELSLVSKSINEVLVRNEALEFGEETDEISTGRALLGRPTMFALLDAAVQQVRKIDHVGMWNLGTRRRLDEEEAERNAKRDELVNEKARTRLVHLGPTVVPRTAIGASQMRTNNSTWGTDGMTIVQQQAVPGIRMNTEAEIYDENGYRYRLGLGGARIPLGDDEIVLDSSVTVVPDDSASQVGARNAGAMPYEGAGPKSSAFW
jgi:hypothetical protein